MEDSGLEVWSVQLNERYQKARMVRRAAVLLQFNFALKALLNPNETQGAAAISFASPTLPDQAGVASSDLRALVVCNKLRAGG